ncbi:Asp-tRNA(Asn)/Glu-tRNA(Gln) amidotransferase subunit GatB [Thiorhodococcus mannitoliphagus]|uniref:Aspartyl/glutamyl-tRNA(Asn/Gln) amidotransferase subunit B n=1 Tax=Thiorhodococcus mannitoliphagus TaxID=329406 RepID=A0A6P1DU28_9GAMM|nr:Asp-tRNA(Asn)/Glu-tRNA(Gln) amidotransferase subunit GatB [Thiorhodococcus mannitoliphagus]NEX20471.1 Asp-tRNA(Asn)/Glu-tRNA(Gln) amidotransferase subunit GatB [Thiorhodococcus mannitoliphagus]
MQWETVIGLEIHTQLATKSKIFSGAPTAFGAEPNTQACAIDLGLPGVLPVLNAEAVRLAVRFGSAIQAEIAPRSVFARKNYFYPDLPKGYQISQYELPVVGKGLVEIVLEDGTVKTIGVTRAHLEEDAGKSLHEEFQDFTGIDLNRAGTPLLEIVSEPDMRSPQDAVAYAKKIHQIVRYIGISDGNMQEGSFRMDANVSVRPVGQEAFGTRAEIKNVNSFRFLEKAIQFEVERQIDLIEGGGTVVQETRLYDAAKDETRSMRTKEEANDYRYFPDPDLLPLEIDAAFIKNATADLPELPDAKRARFHAEHGLSEYDANLLTGSRELADYFEVVAKESGEPKLAANWVSGELMAALNKAEKELAESPVSAPLLAGLIKRIKDGTISGKIAKQVFEAMWQGEGDADQVIESQGLKQITDSGAIETMIDEIIAANSGQVEQYRAGKEKVFGFFVGQAMKASKGKANPQQVNEILKRKLQG